MTKNYILLIVLLLSISSFSQNIYISEINYGTDSGIEIAGPIGASLNGWSLEFYKGTNEKEYNLIEFSQDDTLENGFLWIPISNINKGHPKGAGIALINGGGVTVFIVYNGDFTPKDGTAKGVEPIIIGDFDLNTDESIQLVNGNWELLPPTPGLTNGAKPLSVTKNNIEGFKMYPNPVSNGQLNITSNSWADKQVEIYNLNGQQVYSKLVKHREVLDIYNLNKGIYLVRIIEEEKIATRKLVVN